MVIKGKHIIISILLILGIIGNYWAFNNTNTEDKDTQFFVILIILLSGAAFIILTILFAVNNWDEEFKINFKFNKLFK